MAPKIWFTGLPYNHPSLPPWGWPPEVVKPGLEAATKALLENGYDAIGYFIAPELGIKVFEDKLLEQKWDAVVIGWGVRGNPKLSPWLEAMVNTIREKSPDTKILFNWNPESTIDTATKNLPVTEDCRIEMRKVLEESGLEGRIYYSPIPS